MGWTPDEILRAHRPTLVCGHRGVPARAVENTLPSLEQALREGAALVEFDVRATADGEAVVFHDRKLTRLLGDPRAVAEVTWPELQRLAFEGAPGLHVPSLAQALEVLRGRCVPLVEVKEEAAVAGTLRALAALGMAGQVLVQSFQPGACAALAAANLPTGLLVDSALPSGERPSCALVEQVAAQVGARFVGLSQALPDAAWMASLEARGLPVAVWTVNTLDDMRRILSLGPRVLITDRTAEARDLILTLAPAP